MELQIVNVVWGEKYINTFLELSLPTQLSPGNLSDLKTKSNYIIYTDEKGKAQIKGSAIYKKLVGVTNVIFRIVVIKQGRCRFDIMLKCHADSINQANKINAPISFISPDSIFSSGVFVYLEDALTRGVRLIPICSTRMSLEKYREIAKEKESSLFAVNWPSKELAKLTIKNLHSRGKDLIIKGNLISSHPSHMYFELDENNLLVKAYHLHPLLIWPEKHDVFPKISIDGKKFLELICPDYKNWEIITDCSKISFFEISSDKQFIEDYTHPINRFWFQQWIRAHTSAAHLYFIKHDIILGDGNCKPEWEKVINHAHQFIINLSGSDPSNFYEKYPKRYVEFIKLYLKFVYLFLSGKKKLTLKKIFLHFTFLIKNKAVPAHLYLLKPDKDNSPP